MIPFDLDDRVTAAAVAAAGTIVGALIQLRVSWRKEVSERARGVPITKKARRGPVLAVLVLLTAAGVGGFALSQFLVNRAERDATALRGEVQTQLAQISATAERLERASQSERAAAGHADGAATAPGDVIVTTTVGPCRTHADTAAAAAPGCSEQDATAVTLCGSLPAAAVVTAMDLYARPDDAPRPWADSRAAPGQDLGRARFADSPFERPETEQTKLVCTVFSAWDGEHATSARLVVKYSLMPAVREVARTMIVPVATTH